jgi:ParB/RepB/Spo0J family partition protein
MRQETEIESLDLRFECYRIKPQGLDAELLSSIASHGIRDPLWVFESAAGRILLDGFKRVRCARKLGMGIAPYVSLGADEAPSIMAFLRHSVRRGLSILEQARFVDDLHQRHHLSQAEIAQWVGRSKAWVCMRMRLLEQMPEGVRKRLFEGTFPAYAYLYTLRRFMRINGVEAHRIEAFVEALSPADGLSVRQIEQLAHCCFRGPPELAREILAGHGRAVLKRLRNSKTSDGCDAWERVLLGDLERVLKCQERLTKKALDERGHSPAFLAQANLLTKTVLEKATGFTEAIRMLHDRCGHTHDHA